MMVQTADGETMLKSNVVDVPELTREEIKEIALRNGFELELQEDGSMGLHEYVYKFARELSNLGAIRHLTANKRIDHG